MGIPVWELGILSGSPAHYARTPALLPLKKTRNKQNPILFLSLKGIEIHAQISHLLDHFPVSTMARASH